MSNPKRSNSARFERIAQLLARGKTHAEIAEILDCCTKTIQREVTPAMRRRVCEIERELLTEFEDKLKRGGNRAVEVLLGLMDSDDERMQFRAATSVLDLGRRFHRERFEEWELADRLEALESVIENGPRVPVERDNKEESDHA